MRMSRFDWPDCVVKTRQTGVCSVIRFERSKIDDSKTLHVVDEVWGVACMPVHEFIQLWRIEYYAKNQKSVQSALSDLKRPPERLQSQCNYRPFIT